MLYRLEKVRRLLDMQGQALSLPLLLSFCFAASHSFSHSAPVVLFSIRFFVRLHAASRLSFNENPTLPCRGLLKRTSYLFALVAFTITNYEAQQSTAQQQITTIYAQYALHAHPTPSIPPRLRPCPS